MNNLGRESFEWRVRSSVFKGLCQKQKVANELDLLNDWNL